MVPGIGFFELVVIFIVIYLLFGPQGMVDTARTLARLIKTLRREIARIQHELNDETPPRLAPAPLDSKDGGPPPTDEQLSDDDSETTPQTPTHETVGGSDNSQPTPTPLLEQSQPRISDQPGLHDSESSYGKTSISSGFPRRNWRDDLFSG